MPAPGFRLPPEWTRQDAVLLAWPHAGTDWAANLPEVEASYVALVRAITRFETCVLLVADAAVEARARDLLSAVDPARLRVLHAPYDDTWLRDSGPITLCDGNRFRLLDFRFTGWGGKFEASRDDALVGRLVAAGLFAETAEHRRVDFALEGGAIESDGAGSILSTWACLGRRHPDRDRAGIEALLGAELGARRFLWLEHGELEGDDTDAHIDTLARFAAEDAIVFQACDDETDAHFEPLRAMRLEIAALETARGTPYRLFPLPWPQPIHAADGRRLAASYANFLIVNDAVLVPGYGDPADARAGEVLARAFPGREVLSLPCRPLIEQNGSLHCLTMQLPEGVLR
jgi:agmatine/peptidylarginine deiminase